MTFTLENLINSLAGILKSEYPDYPVYDSANQQGTDYPCFFIFLMPSIIEDHIDDRFYRDIGIDIVFVQQRNIVNGMREIQDIQDFLDFSLETFPYSDGSGEETYIHTYGRSASTEDQELHYKFHIKQRVSLPRATNYMNSLEDTNVGVKEKDGTSDR